jgi:hypothetical protein
MSSFSEFVTYFENIARNHVAIGHRDTEKHFARMEMEEVIGGVKHSMHFPLMVVETYDWQLFDADSDNVMKQRTCAIMLLNKAKDKGSFNEVVKVMSDLEVVMDDIAKLMQYHKGEFDHEVVRSIDLNTVDVVPVLDGLDGSYGFRMVFMLKSGFGEGMDSSRWESVDF